MHQAADTIFDKIKVEKATLLGVDVNSTNASAISLETPVTVLTSGGAETRTLANGREGQRKILLGGTTVTGAITITPASLQGYTNIAIGAAGRGCELLFTGGKWHCISLGYATMG